jgi:cardiolipin synthase
VNAPNVISLARFLCVPVVVWLIITGRAQQAFVVFVIAGLSDAVDGILAKRFGWTTRLGEHLDAVADKTLVVAVYATMGIADWLPAWLVILVLFRDISIVGGWLLLNALSGPRRIRPAWSSKINTAAQIVLASVTLAGHAFWPIPAWLEGGLIGLVAATTVISGFVYLRRGAAAAAEIERLP